MPHDHVRLTCNPRAYDVEGNPHYAIHLVNSLDEVEPIWGNTCTHEAALRQGNRWSRFLGWPLVEITL